MKDLAYKDSAVKILLKIIVDHVDMNMNVEVPMSLVIAGLIKISHAQVTTV